LDQCSDAADAARQVYEEIWEVFDAHGTKDQTWWADLTTAQAALAASYAADAAFFIVEDDLKEASELCREALKHARFASQHSFRTEQIEKEREAQYADYLALVAEVTA